MTVPLLVVDRWPARITSPHGITETARVCLTAADPDQDAALWAWVPEGNPPRLLVHEQWLPAESVIPAGQQGTWRVSTARGFYTVTGGVGCGGCGSIMQVWQPFSPMRFASTWPQTKQEMT